MHLMPHINPFKQLLAGTRLSIVVGFLFCGLVVVSLVYIFQGLEKLENDSARASEWNAERVFNEFEKFMTVMEQHERYERLLPQNEKYIRKLELMRPLGMKLKKQFTILKNEVEKAANFNNLYHAYVFRQMPDYPNVHQNLLNELRALQPTVFGLTEAGSRFFVRGSSYHDLDIRLKPFLQKLSLVAAVASQRQLEYERDRTDRILKLSRYVLIVALLSVLVGLALLIVFTGRTRARQKVIQLENEVNLEIMDQLTIGMAFYDHNHKLVRANQAYRDLYQYPSELTEPGNELEAVIRYDVAHAMYGDVDDVDTFVKSRLSAISSLHHGAKPEVSDQPLPDDRIIEIQMLGLSTGGVWGIYTDVTEKRRAQQQQEERIEELENQMGLETLEHVDVGISIIGADLKVVHNNSVVSEMYGFPESMTQPGQPFERILLTLAEWGVYGDGDPEGLVSDLTQSFSGPWTEWRDDLELPGGKVIDVRTHKLSGGGLAYIHTDVTKEKQAQRLIEVTDKVTGLATFEYLQQQFADILEDAKKNGSEFYGIRIKVDRFQAINEIYGIETGDLLLRQIAIRLKDVIPDGAILTRGQGNEFFLTEACNQSQVAAESSVLILQEVMKDSFPLELDHGETMEEMSFTASAGVVLYPKDGSEIGELLTKSQLALQYAAQQGNSYRYFDWRAARRKVSRDVIRLEADLRVALEKDQFELHYQPQVDLETGRLTGIEALIRWRRPGSGDGSDSQVVSPDDFIPVAEDTGLIIPIGHWVVKEACRQAKLWQEEGYPPVTMSVNISVVEFRQQDLVERIQEVLGETGLAAEWLELEVTESIVADDIERITKVLDELKVLGIGVAIDDFGTGYSSLSYLTRLPFDKLKIDQSFVRNTDRQNWAIVRAVVQLARSLELKIVAEGVETMESMHQLRDLGCHIGQGYYFSRPVPATEFVEYLEENQNQHPNSAPTESRKIFRVGLPTDYGLSYLNSSLAEFRQVHTDVPLRIRCDLSEQLVESLVLGELDTVVAIAHEANKDQLSATWEVKPIWVASLDLTLNDGEAVPLIVHPEGCEYRKRMVECLNAAERAWYVSYQSPDLASLQEAVVNGMGVSALTRLTLDERMRILDVDQGFPALRKLTVGLYTANESQSGDEADLINDWLSESLTRHRH
ncbi:MAG TPA: EAL domain-containing protein [Gammaproteobacteria bacterium]|nr:EAL domain-containing protein [Gammaproteobacteria bacterium]